MQRAMGLKEGSTGRKNEGSKWEPGIIHLQEEQESHWEKATLTAYHSNVQDFPEGNLGSLLVEERGKVESTGKGNLYTESEDL